MHLFLMRHGIAFEHFEWDGSDASRPLTEEGFERTRQVLDALKADKKRAPELDAIWSSPLVRARQTAEIAAEVLGVKMTICEALACGASVKLLQQHFKKAYVPERLMLVGHEPDCGMILSELIGAADPRPFKKAGVAHLRGEFKPRGMELEYQLSPKDLLGRD